MTSVATSKLQSAIRNPELATVAPDDSRVVAALNEYMAALESGHAPDRRSFLGHHPEIAGALVQCLDALEFVQAAGSGLQPLAPGTDALQERTVPVALGDYQLLRVIGRGGMGIVYEAEQLSLGRRVALKILPFAATLNPRHLQRFQQEARAAALLHHSHIVPVYAVGCERSVHYFAMQFIKGRNLDEVIYDARRAAGLDQEPAEPVSPTADTQVGIHEPTHRTQTDPAWFRTAAELGRQAADALEHAHRLGVIHRDVKPSNFLVDEQCHLWITDFGLAHLSRETSLTRTGELIGTLRYMSPEQTRTRQGLIDHRADIYSLGVTLYELLTLTPAFMGTEEELLWKVAFKEPLAPRSINKAIPADLETIVLKAMAKEPQLRYDTAQDLADDLRRFLDDKPIRAKRPTVWERAGRWARRHKKAVAAALAVLVLAVVGLAISTVLLWHANERTANALADARTNFDIAEEQRKYAEKERQLALRMANEAKATVDDMYTAVAEQWLERQGELDWLQLAFLRKAAAFYEKFVHEHADDAPARVELARAHYRLARMYVKLSRIDEANASHAAADALLRQLAAAAPNVAEFRKDQAYNKYRWGFVFHLQGRLQDAERAFNEAQTLFSQLIAAHPDVASYRASLALVRAQRALVQQDADHLTDAEQSLRAAIADLEPIAAASKAELDQHNLAVNYMRLGGLLRDEGRPADAEVQIEQALRIASRLLDAHPTSSDLRNSLSNVYHVQGMLRQDAGQWSEAEQAYRLALAQRERLAADYPRHMGYRFNLALTLTNLSGVLESSGNFAQAETTARRATGLYAELLSQAALPRNRLYLAKEIALLGRLLVKLQRPADAAARFLEARRMLEALIAEFPNAADYQSELGAMLSNHATLLCNHPEAPEILAQGCALLEEAIRYQRQALKANPHHPSYRRFLRNHCWGLANLRLSQGAVAAAAEAAENAVTWLPDDPETLAFVGANMLTWCAINEPDASRAQRYALRAVVLAEKAVQASPASAVFRRFLAFAQCRAGDWQRGLDTIVAINEPDADGCTCFYRAMAHWRLKDPAQARLWYDQGVALAKENKGIMGESQILQQEAAKLLGVADPQKRE